MTAMRAILRIGRCTRRPASVSYARILFDGKQKIVNGRFSYVLKQLVDGKRSPFDRYPSSYSEYGFYGITYAAEGFYAPRAPLPRQTYSAYRFSENLYDAGGKRCADSAGRPRKSAEAFPERGG